MRKYLATAEGLATATGLAILAASTNANVLQTGGWLSSHALLVGTLSLGVFAGARVVGSGVTGKVAAVIIVALSCGELFNFAATSERTVVERENGSAPLKDALAKHNAALAKLETIEGGKIGSTRLSLALDAQKKAEAAYQLELRTGGRCLTICKGLNANAAKADAEVRTAIAEAEKAHQGEIETAKADVAANPLPASATPLADRLGWAPWVLDLIMAGLLSIGANGLAGVLIAFGAHGNGTAATQKPGSASVPERSEPPPGGKKPRSQRQIKANAIASELRAQGVKPQFHIVRNEYRNRHGEDAPKVTIHRACA